MQRKSGLKNMVLERKLEALGDELDKKEAQLGEVLSASNLDPGTLALVSKKLDEVMEKDFHTKILRRLGPGADSRGGYLHRIITWDEEGYR